VLALVNIERANYGLRPLEWHDVLATTARNHSMDMAHRDFTGHDCPDGFSPWDRLVAAGIYFHMFHTAAENIAWGYRTPQAVVDAWMDSPTHRASILLAGLTHLGVGFYDFFWTQKFVGFHP